MADVMDRQILRDAVEAQQKGAWVEAERLWRAIHEQAPAWADGYLNLSTALRAQGRYAEAAVFLATAAPMFPDNAAIQIEHARATVPQNAPATIALWESVLARFPGRPDVLLGLGQAYRVAGRLDAAETLLREATAQFPDHASLMFEYANIAEQRGDTAEAIQRWTVVHERLPRHRETIVHLGKNLRLAGRYDEADAVLTSAPDLLAGSWDMLFEWASVAQNRSDWDAAAQRWEQVRQSFPNRSAGSLGLGTVLWMSGQLADAERIVAQAIEQFPNQRDLLALHARLAHNRHDLDEALLRWRRVADLAPTFQDAARYIGEILQEAGRTAEAEAYMADAVQRLPVSVEVAERHAMLAFQQGDWPEALARWQRIAAHRPDHPTVLAGMGDMLMTLHRHDEAAPVLERLLRVAPRNVRGMILQSRLDTIRGDWQSAQRRLTEARALAPNEPHVLAALTVARMAAMGEATDAAAAMLDEKPAADGAHGQPWQNLMLGYESLGDNCEFGLVQRHFGAEPIGLLRWASIWTPELLDGLASGFARLSDEDDMYLEDTGEYYASRSRAYSLPINTYVPVNAADPVALAPKVRRRLLLLRRKLLEDLGNGEKIFVYKSMANLTDAEAQAIHAVMQKHGPNRLLAVRRADADNPPGSVRCLTPGLAIGHITRYGNEGGGWDIDWDNWLAVCQAAPALLPAVGAASSGAC